MNVELLREVQACILSDPASFQMYNWHSSRNIDLETPPCGTASCIAGWAEYLSACKSDQKFIIKHQRGLQFGMTPLLADCALGLDSRISKTLYHVTAWPESFRLDYCAAFDGKAKARITVKYIDYFIKLHGPQRKKSSKKGTLSK